jgi:outer membrane lipoprotein-sorting protein
MSSRAVRGRLSTRVLTLILGLTLVAALGIGAVAVGAGAQGEPPERLTEAELLSRVTAAPEDAPPFHATVAVEQTVIPEGLIGASEGGDTGDSGPRTARIWRGGPEQLRAELQGENGDKVVVKNGAEVSVYDGASNTLKVGEKPEAEGPPEAGPSPEEIDEFLAEVSPTSNLTTGAPVEFAGRWAYPLTLEPKGKSLTLVERAEVLVDAEAFVPLRFELYAEQTPEPVARYEAQDFEVGPVPDRRFELETPPGATVEQIEPPDGERGDNGREGGEPEVVGSVEEAGELAGFPVEGLAEAPGGRQLEEIRAASGGAVLTYGSGWGTVVLAEKTGGDEVPEPQRETGEGREDGLQVPTVDLGGGVEAREVATPVGTVLSWRSSGVSYTLAGSVPAAELEAAARTLVR